MGWKELTPEERARLVATAINESGMTHSFEKTEDGPKLVARVDDAGRRIIAEAIREAQEAVTP